VICGAPGSGSEKLKYAEIARIAAKREHVTSLFVFPAGFTKMFSCWLVIEIFSLKNLFVSSWIRLLLSCFGMH
jgi:hypothetical protein